MDQWAGGAAAPDPALGSKQRDPKPKDNTIHIYIYIHNMYMYSIRYTMSEADEGTLTRRIVP